MKHLLVVLGLLAVVFLAACQNGPSSADGCASCQAQAAVKAAVPNAPTVACSECAMHQMEAQAMETCAACKEAGAVCEACAAKMVCPNCTDGKKCDGCKLAAAECKICAAKSMTWEAMACPGCKEGDQKCADCTALAAKLDTVTCPDCKN